MLVNSNENEYRNEHGVLPQLDFVNFENPFDNISETAVQHSKYASIEGTKTGGTGKAVKGIFQASFGLLGAVSGGGLASTGMAGEGVGNIISGLGNKSNMKAVASEVTNAIIEQENNAWKFLEFVRNFSPATGNIGDIILKDGSCDGFHCGNGHKFFDNGDYFEGYFEDGEICRGLYIFSDGTRYLGSFNENKMMTGNSLCLYNNGSYYFGNFENGYMNGYGYRLYPDGAFVGEFSNGFRINGGLRLENGACFLGDFENDQPVR